MKIMLNINIGSLYYYIRINFGDSKMKTILTNHNMSPELHYAYSRILLSLIHGYKYLV